MLARVLKTLEVQDTVLGTPCRRRCRICSRGFPPLIAHRRGWVIVAAEDADRRETRHVGGFSLAAVQCAEATRISFSAFSTIGVRWLRSSIVSCRSWSSGSKRPDRGNSKMAFLEVNEMVSIGYRSGMENGRRTAGY
jgi:hypothetical protein